MLYWNKYVSHEAIEMGKRKKFDNNIYSFDIETTSFLVLNGKVLPALEYDKLSKEEQKNCEKHSCMYIWMFSINDQVYYGRTWDEFKRFLNKLDEAVPILKIVYVHNLSFEFQYIKSVFEMEDVFARTARKVMYNSLLNYNIEFRCSYMISNCKLEKLPELYNLPVKKMVGDLDYSKIRTSITPLSEKELGYCENDCLVVYEYIKLERSQYGDVKNIPKTATGHVRRELKDATRSNYYYKRVVSRSVNTDPHIYNLLQQAFMGGYTHSNWVYTDEVLEDVDSWDFTSSYPYVMTTYKFPSTEFKKVNIKSAKQLSDRFAYLLVVRFTNLETKYFNSFISASKCRNLKGAKYDNGRLLSAEEFEITLTDVDFKFFLETHNCDYEILECYYSVYNYLPRKFITFILDKYVIKTKYKDVPGKEIEYQLEKSKFNSLYGMSVTNTIRDEVIYDNSDGWLEEPLSNDEILKKLMEEKKKGFLSFAYGVWVTAHARHNLLENVKKLDQYVVYCDTDSIKVLPGYDKNIILDYNKSVAKRIKDVSTKLNIDIERFTPKDIKGQERMLGVFDDDGHYEEFITQGAKKYAVKQWTKNKKTGEDELKIKITVAGVPKSGAKALKDLHDFKDDFVFEYKDTNKNLLFYVEDQQPVEVTDYLGNKYTITDKSGCCLVPTTYVLGKALEYANLVSDASSSRAIYKE